MKKVLVAVTALLGVMVATSVGQASPTASSASAASCGTTRSIGFMAPFTGPAASVGQLQIRWANFYVKQYNKAHKTKIKLVNEDTQLGAPAGTAEALKAAKALASNSACSASSARPARRRTRSCRKTLKSAGLAWVDGLGHADRLVEAKNGTRGYFFRAVPPDAKQGSSVRTASSTKLKSKNIHIIDDQETYSTGLADVVQAKLKAAGKTVTRDGVSQQESDFSALIAEIHRNVDLIYIPWQLSDKAQGVRPAAEAGGPQHQLMGSDGLFSPDFAALGSNVYDSMFPVSVKNPLVAAYQQGPRRERRLLRRSDVRRSRRSSPRRSTGPAGRHGDPGGGPQQVREDEHQELAARVHGELQRLPASSRPACSRCTSRTGRPSTRSASNRSTQNGRAAHLRVGRTSL